MNCGFIAYTFILENGRKKIANTGTQYTCTDTEHAKLRGTQARNIFQINILLVRKKKHLN